MYNKITRTFEKSGDIEQLRKDEFEKKRLREKFHIDEDWLNKSSIDFGKSVISKKSSNRTNLESSWVYMESQGGQTNNTSTLGRSSLEKSTIFIGDRSVDLGSSMIEREIKWGTASVQIVSEMNNGLSESRVEVKDDTIIIEREVKDLTRDKGTAILMKLELMARVVDLIYTGGSAALSNWDKIICGVAGIMGGGAQMVSFNPYNIVIGGVRVVASVKTMLDAYNKLTATQIQEMIEDSKASIDAIRLLAQANEESLGRVQNQLQRAQVCGTMVQEQLSKIGAIKDDVSQKLLELKEASKNAYSNLDDFLVSTKLKFGEANEKSAKAQKGFAAVVEYLGKMILLFSCKEGSDQDRLKALVDLTKDVYETAERANRDMLEAQRLQSEADESFDKVIHLQLEAREAYGRVDACQQMTIEYMVDAAKKGSEECKVLSDNLNGARADVHDVVFRNEAIRDFSREAADTLGDLMGIQINESRMGVLKLIATGISTLTFNMIFGSTTSIILAVAFVYYANTIANFIADWLARKVAKESTKVELTDEISYEFDYRSEYFLNRARGRVSQDRGTLSIEVGDKSLNIPFDLNRKSSSIRQTDLRELASLIHEAVRTEMITVEKAFELIEALKTAEIKRKTQNLYFADKNINITGFIAGDSAYMKMLEDFLNKEKEKAENFQNFLSRATCSLEESLKKLNSGQSEVDALSFDEAEIVDESDEEVPSTLSVSDLPVTLWC